MNIQKLKQKIYKFINKYSKKKKHWNLIINPLERSNNYKIRKSFVIKNKHLENFKILWNNVNNYYILIFSIFVIIIIYIIFWPIFKIKEINIIKQDDITNMDIAYKTMDEYRWLSIWNADKQEILNKLRNYQHNIKDIKLNINLPNKLNLTINSYKWVFNTSINGKTFIITENGTLIPWNYSNELNEIIVKNEIEKSKFLDYKEILNKKYISNIFLTKKIIDENFTNIKISKITYYVIERELHLETEKNTILIFDLESDSRQQIEKLAIFNKENKPLDKNDFIYIDLRINNKIFYCPKEAEYKCKSNLKSIYSK